MDGHLDKEQYVMKKAMTQIRLETGLWQGLNPRGEPLDKDKKDLRKGLVKEVTYESN